MFEKPSPEPLTGDLYHITCQYFADGGPIPLNVLFRVPENGTRQELDVEFCARADSEDCAIKFTADDIAALKDCIIASDMQDSP